MKRRQFLMVLGGAVMARPLMPRAQQAASIRRVGVLSGAPENDPVVMKTMIEPFQQELERRGWQVGRNLYIDLGWEVIGERARTKVADLVRLAPDVVLAIGTPGTRAMQRLNSPVPVVFTVVSERSSQQVCRI
jgi:putative ABC transport system substrate-binding protein